MKDNLSRRKKAVRLYYYENQTKAEICRQLQCSRPWLDRWLKRYDPDDVEGSLSDRSRAPKEPHSPWPQAIRQQVIRMRQRRMKEPYQLIGAAAIYYELDALSRPDVPPERTIHRWLKAAQLIDEPNEPEETDPKPIPLPQADQVNQVQYLDLKGPVYLRGHSQKHYLVVLRDGYSRRCALDVLTSRQAQGIVDFLVANWHWLGRPQYLQMDNALEFRGPHRYPRSFGRVVRVAVDLEIEPVFIPPGEPWRNGIVESFNGFLDDRLLAVECADLDAFRQQASLCEQVCNAQHRLAALDGLTPDEVAAKAELRLLCSDYQRHQLSSLPQDKGFVSFVRLVRNSGRITLGSGDRFMVDPDLAYTYVLARVDLAQQQVVISQDGQVIKTYDYSADTIGNWAADESI